MGSCCTHCVRLAHHLGRQFGDAHLGLSHYGVSDRSRHNWLIGLINNGEGWHNNHHAVPRCAAHGHKWWELDLTFSFILLLEKIGFGQKRRPSFAREFGDRADLALGNVSLREGVANDKANEQQVGTTAERAANFL